MAINVRMFATFALLLAATAAHAERIDIAAVVGDEIISTNDVKERRDLLMATNNVAPTMENQRRFTPRVIESLVDEKIQMQEARRLSISVSKEELNAAIGQLEESRRVPQGTLRKSFEQQGLSVRSLEDQLTAQLAWSKVVQRKLRREVSISQDEIARAQQAAAADPGVPEVQIAAISILVLKPELDAKQSAFANQLSERIKGGTSIGQLATELQGREDIRISPPGWVPEEKLQPAMQQALRTMQPGEVSPPLRSMNTYQLIQVLARRVAKKVPEGTEVVLKEMVLPLPEKRDEKSMLALRDSSRALAASPGDCMSETVPGSPAKVKYARLAYSALPPEIKPLIADLGVTEVTPPLMTESAVRMFMLCERTEPAMGNLPPVAQVRRELFAEKIELEAQKHLRNLKRDAFIEIKGTSESMMSAPIPETAPKTEEKKPAAKKPATKKPAAKAKNE